MEWFLSTFRNYPELALFMTIAAGFALGKLKYKTFSLGTVTSVLLVGVLVGQMRIDIPGEVKQVFFLLFLFAVGYSVGPQFFNSLKKSGLPQLLFTTIISATALVATWLLAKMMGYNAGQTAGLFSGAQTISAVIGVGGNTIESLPISQQARQSMIDAIPVCYAVTYLFGTIGSAFFLAQVGPLFWGGLKKSRQACIDLAAKMGIGSDDPSLISASSVVVFRAYNISPDSFLVGKTVSEAEEVFRQDGYRIYIERTRKKGTQAILDATPDYRLNAHDDVVLQGKGTFVITEERRIGQEIFDQALLNYQVESIRVLVTNKVLSGRTIHQISQDHFELKITLTKLSRGGTDLPLLPQTVVEKGDMATIIGPKKDVDAAAKLIGIPDVMTNTTDLVSVGLGILLGGLIGVLAFHVGKATISLSTSGGALIAGLLFGWFRSRHPNYAQIPQPALWMLTNLGLNAFIAVVGISAGPSFVDGLKEVGGMLFVIGALASLIPLLVGLILARYVFKFDVAIGLGCCCGARTTTAALPAVQDSLQSPLPTLGYTVTYAVGNTLLIICGIIIVFMIS